MPSCEPNLQSLSQNWSLRTSMPQQAAANSMNAVHHIAVFSSKHLVSLSVVEPGSNKHTSVRYLPYSGAEVDAIPLSLFSRLFNATQLQPASPTTTAMGTQIVNAGTFSAKLQWTTDDHQTSIVSTVIHVLHDLQNPVISKTSQIALGMLPSGYPHTRVAAHSQSSRSTVVQPFANVLQIQAPVSSQFNQPGTAGNSPASVDVTVKRHNPPCCQTPGTAGDPPASFEADFETKIAEFPTIFDGTFHPIAGPPCRLRHKDDAVLVSCQRYRPLAEPLKQPLKDELDSLERQGIIAKVTKPTCVFHPIVLVPKKTGGLRICVDFHEPTSRLFVLASTPQPQFKRSVPSQLE